ncbi:MAG: alanine--tRNA ligase [Actinomycetota bacterium]
MEGSEIRRRFLSFFEERGHTVVPSSSLIPNDPSLLLTTAGMVQFKPYFLGQQEPPYPRATSVQKSFRTTDIENVGRTIRHMTFFEMLGNFSFGDYFKREAIAHAWELVTKGYGVEPERLWATVYDGSGVGEKDQETEELWKEYLPPERIVQRGLEDNFWSMGVAGPCGPCSEIYVDRGEAHGPEGGPATSEERYLEIWNLVFMQYERDDAFNLVGELDKKGVDTGAGLERIAIVLQDVPSVYETDLMAPILDTAQSLSGHTYGKEERGDLSLRILSEHGRAVTFLIADGVVPSNEGRGYVLRRMLRRVVMHARKLGVERAVTEPLIDVTVKLFGEAYPELVERKAFVRQVAASEEEHFGATLRQGIALFEDEVERLRKGKKKEFPGKAAFLYHDTYGFPIEMTVELAEEQGLRVDTDAFDELMTEQRERARAAATKGGKDQAALSALAKEAGRAEFVGYERLDAEGRIVGMIRGGKRTNAAGEGDEVEIVIDRTPFYAEGGGQVGDTGAIRTESGEARVEDTVSGPGDVTVHIARVRSGEISEGQEAEARVDAQRRAATERSHTCTHVVHWTLRNLLGEHARQAGSLVAPGRLRFDFTHFEALSRDRLEEVEGLANTRLAEDSPVRAYETTFEFARSQGALALFGEKYGDLVRVVEVGDYSTELCGGTHVPHTGRVALTLITSEQSIGSGLRRIEALVGPDALEHVNRERRLLEEVASTLGASTTEQALERARRAVARIKELEAALGSVKAEERAGRVDELAAAAADVAGVKLVVADLPGEDAGALRELALKLRDRLEREGHGAAVLASADGGKATLVASCTKALVDRGVTAPALLEPAAKAVGGGAGGKPHLAMAGGGNPGALGEALAAIPDRLAALVGG